MEQIESHFSTILVALSSSVQCESPLGISSIVSLSLVCSNLGELPRSVGDGYRVSSLSLGESLSFGLLDSVYSNGACELFGETYLVSLDLLNVEFSSSLTQPYVFHGGLGGVGILGPDVNF